LKDKPQPADVIFITHAHFDHWSPKDIQKILAPHTKLILVNGCGGLKVPNETIKTEPFKEFTVDNVKVRTIPAYNINPSKLHFHPRSNNWVGYILEVNGVKIYHAGDTDFIPEMKDLQPYVALLPMGGTYTMDVDEMIEAANAIRAKVTVPMHYKRLLGGKSREAEQKVVAGVQGKVEILQESF
jgi:L-ascorbate metabolism protein UlaG (beta-lactamase superfamily)